MEGLGLGKCCGCCEGKRAGEGSGWRKKMWRWKRREDCHARVRTINHTARRGMRGAGGRISRVWVFTCRYSNNGSRCAHVKSPNQAP
eukprot:470400-Rhodomonas_salina.3